MLIKIVGSTCLLSACASQPAQVKADIPLVHSNYGQSLTTQNGQSVKLENLSSPSAQQLVTVGAEQYKIGSRYHSATGTECHKLHLIRNSAAVAPRTRTMCQVEGQWQVLAPLVSIQSGSNEVEL